MPNLELPFEFENGIKISLNGIVKNLTDIADKEVSNEIYICFIYASGRSENSDVPHIGLIGDALYIPEITQTITTVLKNYKVKIESMLDIDFIEKLEILTNDRNPPHLILCGTGDINQITSEFLNEYNGNRENSKCVIYPRPSDFNKPDLICYDNSTILEAIKPSYKDFGCFLMAKNPWYENRIVFLCAGTYVIGTIASLYILNLLLLNAAYSFDPRISKFTKPCILLEGHPKFYKTRIKETNALHPRVDIKNLDEQEPLEIIYKI